MGGDAVSDLIFRRDELPKFLREEADKDRRTSGSPEREAWLMRQAADELERLQELVHDVGGRSTEFAVVKQLEAIRDAMRKGDAPEALKNLSAACATLAGYSIAHGRWAVAEGENVNAVTAENDQLKAEVAALREVKEAARLLLTMADEDLVPLLNAEGVRTSEAWDRIRGFRAALAKCEQQKARR